MDTTTANQEDFGSDAPSFLRAANIHQIMNSVEDKSEFSAFGWLSDIGKSAALTVGSGISQLLDVAPAIGNAFGGNYERVNFLQAVKDYDDDLGKYYEAHQKGIDAFGFALSSIVPGMVGVKGLRWGQTVLQGAITGGVFGQTTGRALGLLVPETAHWISKAQTAVRTTGEVYSSLEANTLRAILSGFGQQALESAAFETAVAATMFDGPVLKDMDRKDLLINGLVGVGIGGAVGGAIEGLLTRSAIRGTALAAEKQLSIYSEPLKVQVPLNDPAASIVMRTQALADMPAIPATGDLIERATKATNSTLAAVSNSVREDFTKLANGDQVVAQRLFEDWKSKDFQQVLELYHDTAAITRLGARRSSEEVALSKISAKLKKSLDSGLTDEELNLWANTRVNYLVLRGENAGDVLLERPAITSIVDTMSPTAEIKFGENSVSFGKAKFVQPTNPNEAFNISNLSHQAVEARQIFVEHLPAFAADTVPRIHYNDIPLIDKAVRESVDSITVVARDLTETTIRGRDAVRAYAKQAKQELIADLQAGKPMQYTLDELVDKITNITGTKINLAEGEGFNGFWARVRGEVSLSTQKIVGDAIALNPATLIKTDGTLIRSLMDVLGTVKHEEGHSIFQSLLDTRGLGRIGLDKALERDELIKELWEVSKKQRAWLWKSTDPKHIDYRTSYHELFADAFSWFSRNPERLSQFPEFNQYFGSLVRPVPQTAIDALTQRVTKASTEEIAKIANVRPHVVEGRVTANESDWFARDFYRTQEFKRMEAVGARRSEQPVADPLLTPAYAKIVSSAKTVTNENGTELAGIAAIKQRIALYENESRLIAAQNLGMDITKTADGKEINEIDKIFPRLSDYDAFRNADTTAGAVTHANADYGTIGSTTQWVGLQTHRIKKVFKERFMEPANPVLAKLVGNTDAAIEWSMLNETLRGLPQRYKWDRAKMQLLLDGDASLALDFTPAITVKSPLVADMIELHMKNNGDMLDKLALIRNHQGLFDSRNKEYFYPIPRDIRKTPYFAFVVDDSMTSTGHHGMIYAADEAKLETLKNSILSDLPPGWKVLSKADSEAYFKAHGQFEFERSIHENKINEFLVRKGRSQSMLPITDPQKIAEDFIDWHTRRLDNVVRETVSHIYERQFNGLRALGGEQMNLANSKFNYTSAVERINNSPNNPALNLIKQALDVQKTADYPVWTSLNNMLDSKVSWVWDKVSKLWESAVHPDHLESVNKALREHGYEGPIVTDTLYKAINSEIPKGVLTDTVNKMNGLLATFALRLDPFNALNNAIGHNVLYAPEIRSVLNAIKEVDSDVAGKLTELIKMEIPGTGDKVLSAGYLMKNNIEAFFQNKELKELFRKRGVVSTIMDQYDQTLDRMALALVGKGKADDVLHWAIKGGDMGEKLTGNRLAEEFNRFCAANTMKQLTDRAIEIGAMDEATAWTYINTFVNRTNGNYLASQRPMMFQGPIGQAIGLFQTYQFNLLQQLFRHVENREGKTVLTLLGMQGGIYGLNGLPAFNAINTHVIGTAAGNKEHNDLYTTTYGAVGKKAGDWLTYGAGANFFSLFHPDLANNIYTRGDINPRQFTLVPVNPADMPIFSTMGKFYTNAKDSFQKMANGADAWGTFLSAIEHNGVSRPLVGLSVVLSGVTRPDNKVVTTTTKDNLIMAHDVYSLTSLMRLAGAKPLDEALLNDDRMRWQTYKAADTKKITDLGAAVKTSILYGEKPDTDQIAAFARHYAEAGGKQERFAQFMAAQYKNTSVSQANQLKQSLEDWRVRRVQTLLGGYQLEDLQ